MHIGDVISHYQVTGTLGAGGMGEVFRATDTALRREVAIKVLPREVRQHADRLARFRREAHVLASLNHPNIAAIYGFEEAGDPPFLVLELVEGETIAQRLKRGGAIPVTEALEMARQIAEALEAAHERGIVHRDLKPANVKVTTAGTVKVLDFGLAKAWSAESGTSGAAAEASLSPTFAPSGTRLGVILGTAAYMSPEQARGRAVDRRADIWAFGVLLFEMLTGRRLFGGETITDTIAAVVTAQPDFSALPPDTPPAVRRLLRRCLQKDPRQRLPDIGSARIELAETLSGTADRDDPPAGPSSGRVAWSPWIPVLALLLIAGGAGAGLLAGRAFSNGTEPPPVARLDLALPLDVRSSPFSPPIVSPDGRHVIIAASKVGADGRLAGSSMLWIRHLDSNAFEPIPGTEGADRGFWSPDSRSIGFVANSQLRRVGLGGSLQVLATLDTPFWAGGTWSPHGTIVISKGAKGSSDPRGASLVSVPATGGSVRTLTTLAPAGTEGGHYWPEFLPDGRRVAFVVFGANTQNRGVYVTSLDDGSRREPLIAAAATVSFASGHLLFVRGDTLLAQPFDPRTLRLTADPVPVASPVDVWSPAAVGMFSASQNGVIAYTAPLPKDRQLAWVGRDGRTLATIGAPRPYGQLALSIDDRRAAVEIPDAEGRHDIWIVELARGVLTRVTSDAADDRDPVWSPDGSEIVFRSLRGGETTLYRKSLVDGRPESPMAVRGDLVPESWTLDGSTLLYVELEAVDRVGWRWPLGDPAGAVPVVRHEFIIDELQVSPDAGSVAYASVESGRYEVYLRPLASRGEKLRISTDGGGQPKWRRDGRELFYLAPDGMVMAVPVRRDGGLSVGLPAPLFRIADWDAELDQYAPSADGQRFLVKLTTGPAANTALHTVINWDRLAR